MTGSTDPEPFALAERVAAVAAAQPGVAALSGGADGSLATYDPGRKVTGVRVMEPDEPVAVGVVVRLDGPPIPELVAALRRAVAAVCPGRAVAMI